MTTVPPTQPPAAPEGETDANGLTAGEIAMLGDGVAHTTEALCWTPSCAGSLPWAVERIVAERVRIVEGERDAALGRYAEREQRWHWNLIREQNAIFKANAATARAESAEAALADLRAGVEALLWFPSIRDEVSGKTYPPRRKTHVRVRDLRALLGGAS